MNIQEIKKKIQSINAYRGCDCKRWYIPQQEEIIKQANLLLTNTFVFDKVWDMERCPRPYTLPKELDWNTSCHDDEEWTFMLNRMDYLSFLIQAYVLTSDIKYADKCMFFMFDWIEKHQPIQPMKSTRTLDSAMRLSNMVDAMLYLYDKGLLSDQEIECLCVYFNTQIQYLKQAYVPKYTLSNWGSIQVSVIAYVLPLLEEEVETNPIFQWAKQELATQLAIQVYDDGVFWEQSTMYHVEVLHYVLKYIHMSNALVKPAVENACTKAYQLSDALYSQMTPSRKIEAFGDSDCCLIEDILSRACLILKEKKWLFVSMEQLDIESVYCLGSHVAEEYSIQEASIDEQLYFDGIDSGMFTARSSWQNDAHFMMFTNGSLGSGHGHCDNLHFSLHYQGKPFLIDIGRFTYVEENPLRSYFKSVQAHNSVIIDEVAHSIPLGSWEYAKFCKVYKTYARHEKGIHYCEGAIQQQNPNVNILRKIMFIDKGIWCVFDEIHAEGTHKLTSFMHLHPHVEVTKQEEVYHLLQEGCTLLASFGAPQTIQRGKCSLRYNELESHSYFVANQQFKDTIINSSSFYPQTFTKESVSVWQDQEVADTSLVSAIRFASKEESYTMVIFHQEVYMGRKIFYCENVAFHAKSIVIHCKKEITTTYRLKC